MCCCCCFVCVNVFHIFYLLCFRLRCQGATKSAASPPVSRCEATRWPLVVCPSSTSTPVWSGSSARGHRRSTQHQVRTRLLFVCLQKTHTLVPHTNNRTVRVTGGAWDLKLWCLCESPCHGQPDIADSWGSEEPARVIYTPTDYKSSNEARLLQAL